MQSKLYCKILAIGIICLFIGVGIHPAFAVDTRQSIVADEERENEFYVDPNLHLNRIHLPMLKRSLNYYRQSDNRDIEIEGVVEEIIRLIEVNDEVKSEDVENILLNCEIEPVDVYTNCSISGYAYGGYATVIPLTFISMFTTFIIGIGGYLSWQTEERGYGYDPIIDIRVGSTTYTRHHEGRAYGFRGLGRTYLQQTPWDVFSFRIFFGFAKLVFVDLT